MWASPHRKQSVHRSDGAGRDGNAELRAAVRTDYYAQLENPSYQSKTHHKKILSTSKTEVGFCWTKTDLVPQGSVYLYVFLALPASLLSILDPGLRFVT